MSRFSHLFCRQTWGRLATVLFGRVNYQPPEWLVHSAAQTWGFLRRRPREVALVAVLTFLALCGIRLYLSWWESHKSRTKQVVEFREITGKLKPPGITPVIKGKAVGKFD